MNFLSSGSRSMQLWLNYKCLLTSLETRVGFGVLISNLCKIAVFYLFYMLALWLVFILIKDSISKMRKNIDLIFLVSCWTLLIQIMFREFQLQKSPSPRVQRFTRYSIFNFFKIFLEILNLCKTKCETYFTIAYRYKQVWHILVIKI